MGVTGLESLLHISTSRWARDRLMSWMVLTECTRKVLHGKHVHMLLDRQNLCLRVKMGFRSQLVAT